jgi:hypothetical protein
MANFGKTIRLRRILRHERGTLQANDMPRLLQRVRSELAAKSSSKEAAL